MEGIIGQAFWVLFFGGCCYFPLILAITLYELRLIVNNSYISHKRCKYICLLTLYLPPTMFCQGEQFEKETVNQEDSLRRKQSTGKNSLRRKHSTGKNSLRRTVCQGEQSAKENSLPGKTVCRREQFEKISLSWRTV